MNTFDKNCLTCKHWKGNKEKQWAIIRERGIVCMDTQNGWPESGTCANFFTFADIEFEYDYGGTCIEFDANFGCIFHIPDKKEINS